jgi:hypothetical protein
MHSRSNEEGCQPRFATLLLAAAMGTVRAHCLTEFRVMGLNCQ